MRYPCRSLEREKDREREREKERERERVREKEGGKERKKEREKYHSCLQLRVVKEKTKVKVLRKGVQGYLACNKPPAPLGPS